VDLLTYAVEVHEAAATVRLHGELCLATVAGLRAVIGPLQDRPLVLDLGGLRFVDSSGIGLLVETHRECQARGGHLALVNVGERHRRIFEVVGVLDLLDLA
jgi:anti-anti-sigma factor